MSLLFRQSTRLRLMAGGASSAALVQSVRNKSPATQCQSMSSGSAVGNSPIQLYQYKICPFCNKAKAYMDYLGIEYSAVEVNPLTKSELSFTKEYKKVPVAVIGGQVIGDSTEIIDKIKEVLQKKGTDTSTSIIAKKVLDKNFYPSDTVQWSEWADKKLAVMLYPNITRSMEESWECFQYTDNVLSWNPPMRYATKVAGTIAMSFANGKIKKKYGIVDERKELKDTLKVWTDALKSNDFLHGKNITMPDLMVYGVLHAIEGLQTFHVIMDENALLKAWFYRVQQQMPYGKLTKP